MLFIKGMLLGFFLAAPIGPIGILCIRRTLAAGFFVGLFTGLGVAVADMVYGLVAAYGLTVVTNFLTAHNVIINSLSSALLAYLGLYIFFAPAQEFDQNYSNNVGNFFSAFVSTFFLTLANPATLLSFIALLVATGINVEPVSNLRVFLFLSGIFFGSMAWWVILASSVAFIRKKISSRMMKLVNQISGSLIIAFAIYVFIKIFI